MAIETNDIISALGAIEQEAGAYELPELFLENTKLRAPEALDLGARIATFFADPKRVMTARQAFKSYALSARVALSPPEPGPGGASFDAVIRSRRSARLGESAAFGSRPVSAAELSLLLFYTYGVNRVEHAHAVAPPAARPDAPTTDGAAPPAAAVASTVRFRTCPSAGGLFPLEVYAVVLNVADVSPGVYHYNAHGHYLEVLRAAEDEEFFERARGALGRGSNFDNVSVILVTTATPLRSAYKYGERGYRFLMIEAGHAAQNAALGATALGLASCSLGGFLDDDVNRLIGVNGVDELALYVMVVGSPRAAPGRPEEG